MIDSSTSIYNPQNIKYMLNSSRFNVKPNSSEAGRIKKNLITYNTSISSLKSKIIKGHTFCPAIIASTNSESFIEQQVFALDFDKDTSIKKEIDRCSKLKIFPAFGYKTFSYKEDKEKFRFVFINESIIYNKKTRDDFQKLLIKLFECDSQCSNADRIFFGGTELINFNDSNLINHINIFKKFSSDAEVSPQYLIDSNTTEREARKLYINKQLRGIFRENFHNIKPMKKSFKTYRELMEFISSIDFSILLGVDSGKNFNCILKNHDDFNPSANIFKGKNGTYIYKCFGCGKSFTLLTLIENIEDCSRTEAIKKICDIYELELQESELHQKLSKMIDNNISYLNDKDFGITYPNLYNFIRKRKRYLIDLYYAYKQQINDNMCYKDFPYFVTSYESLTKTFGISKGNASSVSKTLALLALLGFIIKMSDRDVDNNILKHYKDLTISKGYSKHVTFFAITELRYCDLTDTEELCKFLNQKNFNLTGLSRELVYRTLGADYANFIYPQHEGEHISEKSNEKMLDIVDMIFKSINEKGYFLESDYCKINLNDINYKKCLNEILNSYNLKRITASTEIKSKLNIQVPFRSFPKILIKNLEN